jgi:UV DNA damage endonuclease
MQVDGGGKKPIVKPIVKPRYQPKLPAHVVDIGVEPLRLGYACLNTNLRDDGVFSSRGIILKNANLKGVSELQRLVLLNIEDTKTILHWNEEHGIRSFRLTSVILPHYTQPNLDFKWDMEFADGALRSLGDLARKYSMRITTHPDHFSYQISSLRPEVVRHAIEDLKMHDEILTRMGMDSESVMTVHGPAPLGDKLAALERWEAAYKSLPDGVRHRLVLENDEFTWGVAELLPVCERNNVPFVLDWFHNSVSRDRVEITDELLERILATWKCRGLRPLMHYSEQDPDNRVGSHSQTVS